MIHTLCIPSLGETDTNIKVNYDDNGQIKKVYQWSDVFSEFIQVNLDWLYMFHSSRMKSIQTAVNLEITKPAQVSQEIADAAQGIMLNGFPNGACR